MGHVPHARAVTTGRPLNKRVAAGLVFLTSGAVLVLEIAGLRLVGPYVGVTLETSTAIIGVALGAIAYGAWTGGWLADRNLDPAKLLSPLLLLGAATTAATLPLVRVAGEWLRGTDPGSVMLLAMLTLFVPAALLSAVTPLVVKLQLGDLGHTGRVVGKLSSVGTLGGITATFGTGFVLVAAVPTSGILYGLAGILTVAGFLFMGYWRKRAPVTVALAVVACGVPIAIVAPNPCEVESAYHCATVTADPARPSGRTLLLNGAQHSYVDLDDPRHLEFAYTRWIASYVDALPAGRLDALHLGGGGFTMPGYLAATRPGTDSLVLELDAKLVELDRRRLGLRTGPSLRVVTGDARANLSSVASSSRDLVIGDAFGHLAVPWHLTTRELVEDVRRVLRPGGVYALNVIDGTARRFVRAELATIAAVFPHVALVAPPSAVAGRVGSNFVILASASPLLAFSPPDDASVVTGSALRDFVGSAAVLTDDHAPVDQLLTFS
ncbi:fused MFS/spermidine synthase [Dactylosporangium sp. AC04546]|uniref:fused MFS/spermidine synthase n=1 Tax=Dactylosporangium sp. AC04546 TaxID=2862460 RepID=UPI001EDDFCD0|nr:fused MFS/spermidine synthase [Dactylosporangium sp. AC04546]WVK89869.1 fused MFS/spermidine synthase [Dactylosporangium sp. AC04546]